MRPIIQWCAACWIDKDRVLSVAALNGVPLCRGCAAAFAEDSESLERLKKEWEALPDIDDHADEPSQRFESAEPKAVHTPPRKCSCGKPLGHTGRCAGNKPASPPIDVHPNPSAPIVRQIPIKVGDLEIAYMKTTDYVAKYGSFRSKGMDSRTQELWERLRNMQFGDCIVVTVPQGTDVFKMRSRLSNTVQRLVRVNKPPFRIAMGANKNLRHIVISKEERKESI